MTTPYDDRGEVVRDGNCVIVKVDRSMEWEDLTALIMSMQVAAADVVREEQAQRRAALIDTKRDTFRHDI